MRATATSRTKKFYIVIWTALFISGLATCNEKNQGQECSEGSACPSQICTSDRVCTPIAADAGSSDADSTPPDLVKNPDMAVQRWPRRLGGKMPDRVSTIAVDAAQNVLVGGSFFDKIDFAAPDMIMDKCSDLSSNGGTDAFLAKFSAGGTCSWALSFGSAQADEITSIAVDSDNNILATGYMQGSINLGPNCMMVSAGDRDAFLVKFDQAGVCLWAKNFGSSFADIGASVAIDSKKNIFLVGSFQGAINLGNGVMGGAGNEDIFLGKFNDRGTALSSNALGGANADVPSMVALGTGGRVLVTGRFRSEIAFCTKGKVGTDRTTDAGFVFELDDALSCVRANSFAGTGDTRGKVIAPVGADGVLVGGTFTLTLDIGGKRYNESGAVQQGDVFVAKLRNGTPDWSMSLGSPAADSVNGMSIDSGGDGFLIGSFTGELLLPGGKILRSNPADKSDAFIIRLGLGGGDVLWADRQGGIGADAGNAVVSAPAGLFVGGAFRDTWDKLMSAGESDGFITLVRMP